MQRCLALALSLICYWSAPAVAKNVLRLYPREKLEADAARYGEQIRAKYHDTILPQLTEAERTALKAIKIDIPVSGPNADPFEFYTDGGTIYLPSLSLRFYTDLCVANAWLNIHGLDGTTVRDYVGVLFREAAASPRAPLPPVFHTLGVPDNACEETAVSNLADRNFGNTIVFLLAHELGHILKKHRTDLQDPVQRRIQEIQADQFAIEVMRRAGMLPLGLKFWFDVERIRHIAPLKIPTEAEWQKEIEAVRHPVTNERLEALAAAIERAPYSFASNQVSQLSAQRMKMFAQYLRLSAPFASDPVARVAEYSRVRELRLVDLKPRESDFTATGTGDNEQNLDRSVRDEMARAAEYERTINMQLSEMRRKAGFIAPGTTNKEQAFNGLFRVFRASTAFGHDEVDLLLQRTGNEVVGSYTNFANPVTFLAHPNTGKGNIEGSIRGRIEEGVIDGGVLHFTWSEGGAQGHGRAELLGGMLRGTWGNDEAEGGAGSWAGARRKDREGNLDALRGGPATQTQADQPRK